MCCGCSIKFREAETSQEESVIRVRFFATEICLANFYKSALKRSRRAPCMAPSPGPAERRGSALINPASHPGD